MLIKQKLIEKAVKPFIIDNRKKESPWIPMKKSLRESRVALVTTAGVHLRDQEPFNVKAKIGDASYREVPSDSGLDQYVVTHSYYDHAEADKDINCVFPITRLKELAEEGFIKEVATVNFGFMGFVMKSLHSTLKENAKEVARKLLADQVDVVLLTPG